MKKSRSVTLALVGSALLASGCGGSRTTTRTFYNKDKQPVPRSEWKKADGTPNDLYDAQGNPVSPDEISQAYSSTTGSSTTSYRRSYGGSSFFWGPSWGSSSHGYSSGSPSHSGGSVSRGGFGSTGGSHAGGSSSS